MTVHRGTCAKLKPFLGASRRQAEQSCRNTRPYWFTHPVKWSPYFSGGISDIVVAGERSTAGRAAGCLSGATSRPRAARCINAPCAYRGQLNLREPRKAAPRTEVRCFKAVEKLASRQSGVAVDREARHVDRCQEALRPLLHEAVDVSNHRVGVRVLLEDMNGAPIVRDVPLCGGVPQAYRAQFGFRAWCRGCSCTRRRDDDRINAKPS